MVKMITKIKRENTQENGDKAYCIYWRKDLRFRWRSTTFYCHSENNKFVGKTSNDDYTYKYLPREVYLCIESILRGLNSNG